MYPFYDLNIYFLLPNNHYPEVEFIFYGWLYHFTTLGPAEDENIQKFVHFPVFSSLLLI